jgi:hypothetical protein
LREEPRGFSFSPDSRLLYTAMGWPRVIVEEHMLRTEDLIAEICGRLGQACGAIR